MKKSLRSKLAPILGVCLLASALGVAAFPGTASADTALAAADAGHIKLLGATIVDPAAETRTGGPGGVTPDPESTFTQPPLLNAAVLGQDTFVDQFGHAGACAGLVTSTGTLNVLGGANPCAGAGNLPPGAGLQVNITGLITLRLNAVYAECTASSTAVPTANAFVAGDLVVNVLGNLLTAPLNAVATDPFAALATGNPAIDIPLALILNPVISLTLQQESAPAVIGGGSTATALSLQVLNVLPGGASVADIVLGQVACGPNSVTTDGGNLAFDTTGDIDPLDTLDSVQDGTRNAITATYTPAGDRANVTVRFAIDTTKLAFDTTDPAYSGCELPASDTDPDVTCVVNNGNVVTGPGSVTRTVPVRIKPGTAGEITATATIVSSSPGADVPLTASVDLNSESTSFVVQAGAVAPAIGSPAGTQLPGNIPGELYADVPYYVEYVEYDGEACTILDEVGEVIPGLYDTNLVPTDRNLFDCGSSISATQDFRITVAPDAPTNVDGTGRIVIRRTGPVSPLTPPAIPNNTYTSDINIDVTAAPPADTDPAVEVTTDVSPTAIPAPGGDFTYTVKIKNTSAADEEITSITQRVNGGTSTNVDGLGTCDNTPRIVLVPNQTYTCSFVDEFLGDTGDSETHLVTATVEEVVGTETATDSDPATAFIGDALVLDVDKVAVDDELPIPGGDFTFEVTIHNPNDVAITIDEITDTIDGDTVELAGSDDCQVGTVLGADGEDDDTCSFTFDVTFERDTAAEQTDVVLVVGSDADGNPATGDDDETVNIIEPNGLLVTKTADDDTLPEPGGKVTYTVTIANVLDEDLEITEITEDIVGDDDDAVDLAGDADCKVGTTIEGGEECEFTFTDTLEGNADDEFTDVVTAVAENEDGDEYTDSDTETVTLADVLPQITVSEAVTPAARKTPGGEFTWTITIENTSKASSDPVTITSLRNELVKDITSDDLCGEILGVTLDVGETASCTFTTKVEGPDGKVTSDIAVAVAEDDEGNATSDLGTAAVSLTAADAATTTTVAVAPRTALPKTGANARTMAAAAMLFAGLGLVLTGGGMQQEPVLTTGERRRRRR